MAETPKDGTEVDETEDVTAELSAMGKGDEE